MLHLPFRRLSDEAKREGQRAQDAFEYLLVIGGVSVAVILAMITPIGSTLIDAVVGFVTTAISGIFS